MRTVPSHPGPTLARLGSLAWGCLVLACVDQGGPVLPTLSSAPDDESSSGKIDGGQEGDTLPAGNVASSGALVTLPDAGVFPCDLLSQQSCATILGVAFGCYPVGGAGRCEQSGGIGALGSCSVDTDCNPGLLCEVLSGPGSFGVCQPICNLGDPTSSVCSSGETCRSLQGFSGTNVGRCTSS